MINCLPFAVFTVLLLVSCGKTDIPPSGDEPGYTVTFVSRFSILQNETAAFLSDDDGQIRLFQWLPGLDTTKLVVADTKEGERFDLTIVGVLLRSLPGTNLVDTFLTMKTYTNVADGSVLDFIPVDVVYETDFQIKFTGISTLDSIVVPNGVTFAQPQPDNNFQGEYQVLHNGQFWCRIKLNGEPNWRYLLLNNVTSSGTLNITRDVATLPELPNSPAYIGLPFFTNWTYKLDKAVNASQDKFLVLGPQLPIPGGVVPLFDALPALEPPGLPNHGYRLWLLGTNPAPGGYGYECDRLFTTLPATAPALDIDIQPTNLADKRLVAVTSSGPVDVLSFTRFGSPNLTWEVLAAPATNGPTVYRLPDVPSTLSDRFPALRTYDLGSHVQVRAERYDQFDGYDAAIRARMQPQDPLWRAKAGYLARQRTFF
ncbi:MAG: hypothetical protein ABMA02_01685 [Saprospiraceae bacterium]